MRAKSGRTRWAWITAAIAVLIVVPTVYLQRGRAPSLSKLIALAAEDSARPAEPWLSGFAWRNAPRRLRGAANDDRDALRLRLAALDLVGRLGVADDADELHSRGVARLLAGDGEGAVADLHEAAQRTSSAIFWNDLAAAQLAQAERGDDVERYATALSAADRALAIDPRFPEAHFNRGLALESLGLSAAAADAYEECRRIDPSSLATAEITERLARLRPPRDDWRAQEPSLRAAAIRGDREMVRAIVRRFPQQSRTWAETEYLGRSSADDLLVARTIAAALVEMSGESLLLDAVSAIDHASGRRLRDAHERYRHARVLYSSRKVGEALPILQSARAVFEEAGSPMQFVTAYYCANALTDLGRVDEAPMLLADAAKAPARYRALHAQIEWQTATLAGREGHFHKALAHYRAALDAFNRLGESEHATTMEISAATCLATLGSFPEAWRLRRAAFERASAGGNVIHLQQVLAATARWEARRLRWDVARAMLNIATDETIGRANVRLWVDSLVWSSRAARALGNRDDAARQLARAHTVAQSIPDAELRSDAEADIDFAEAAMMPPAEAVASLTRIAAFCESRRRSHQLVETLTERGRRLRELGRIDEAAADFGKAADLISAHAKEIGDQAFRSGFSRSLRAPFDGLVDLLDERGLARDAYEAAERSRLAAATELGGSLERVGDVQGLLPPGALLLSYYQLENRLVITAVSKTVFISRSSNIGRREMSRRVADLIHGLAAGKASDAEAAALYRILIEPFDQEIRTVAALIVVADADLRNVPFGALRRDAQARYLIEQFPIAVAPNASVLLRVSAPAAPRPMLVRGSDAGRETLPAADDELRRLRSLWPAATVVDRANSTPEVILRELARATLFHYTGHAVSNTIDASLSYLATGPAPLYVREVTRMRLPSLQLAFLAGCETAIAGGHEAAPESLATAFVLAGARNAAGSLWRVDDRVTAELSDRFYRELQRSGDAPRALRDVQVSFIRSGDPELSAPAAWAAMQMYGSTN